MGFEEKCNDMGGKVQEISKPEMTICRLEDKDMAITKDGRTLPIGEPRGG